MRTKLSARNAIKALILWVFATGVGLTLSAPASAQDAPFPIGQIAAIEGEAFYFNGESRKKAVVTDPVFLNSVLETGAGSKLLVVFIDDTEIALGENAELIIDEYVFDPYDPEENEGTFSVTKGAFYWISGMLSKRDEPQVDIATPMGSIGIRGTEFWAGEIEDGYGVFVDDGLVNFSGTWGQTDLSAGTGAFIRPDKESLKDQKGDFWNVARKAGAMERVTFHDPALPLAIEKIHQQNVAKRHDYRSRMFPYKENPFGIKLKSKQDDFFTDEFEEMREGQ